MKVQELFEEKSDLLFWLQKLLDKGETVMLKAHDKGDRVHMWDHFEYKRRPVEGRIMLVKDGHIVYDHQKELRRTGTISNSFFMFKEPIDDNYKIHKIADGEWAGYYELADA